MTALDRALVESLLDAEAVLRANLDQLRQGDKRVSSQIQMGRMSACLAAYRSCLQQRGVQLPATTIDLEAFRAWPEAVAAHDFVAPASVPLMLDGFAAVEWRSLLELDDDAALLRALVSGVVLGCPFMRVVSTMAKEISLSAGDAATVAETLYQTAVGIAGQAAEDVYSPERLPSDVFWYFGPVDNLVRPFCLEHVGKVYTRRSIEQMDNGELSQPFLTRGGWNCRHQWCSVSRFSDLLPLADREIVCDDLAARVEQVRREAREPDR